MKVSSNELSSVAPIWAAYNSLITERKDKTIVQQLPILNGTPTCWENLYRAMKDCEKLNKELSNGSKTVILFARVRIRGWKMFVFRKVWRPLLS